MSHACCKPRFMRTVGRHRVNTCGLTLTYGRKELGEDEFGAIAPNWCSRCGGVWEELDECCHFRGSYWQPPDYSVRCPHCGREEAGEHEYPELSFKIISRHKTTIHAHRSAA